MSASAPERELHGRLLDWYAAAARDLPWRGGASAWGVFVSEVMLQQTPVVRVEPVWHEWMRRWPTPGDLAAEVRRRGIRVTALLPGAVDTPFWDAVGGGPDRAQMLRPEAVGETIRTLLDQPPDVATDELVLMPPFGIL